MYKVLGESQRREKIPKVRLRWLKKGAKPDRLVPRSNNLIRYSSSPEASAAGAALTFE